MATIVPRQGPELDQDERVGLLAAQPYDKMVGFGGFWPKTPKMGGRGGNPQNPGFGGFPPPPGGVKNPHFGGPGGPPKRGFLASPPLSKTDFFVFDPKRRGLNASLYPNFGVENGVFGTPPKMGVFGGFWPKPPKMTILGPNLRAAPRVNPTRSS